MFLFYSLLQFDKSRRKYVNVGYFMSLFYFCTLLRVLFSLLSCDVEIDNSNKKYGVSYRHIHIFKCLTKYLWNCLEVSWFHFQWNKNKISDTVFCTNIINLSYLFFCRVQFTLCLTLPFVFIDNNYKSIVHVKRWYGKKYIWIYFWSFVIWRLSLGFHHK